MADVERNNDPLENFFKSHTENYDINYKEDDWQKLEKRLNLADEKHVYWQRMRWMAAAAALLFCILVYFTYQNYTSIKQISNQFAGETKSEVQQNTDGELNGQAGDQPDTERPAGEIITNDETRQRNDSGNLRSPASEELQAKAAGEIAGNENSNQTREKTTESSGAVNPAEVQYVSVISCTECTSVSSDIETVPDDYAVAASSLYDRNIAGEQDDFNSRSLQNSNPKTERNASLPIALGLVLGPDLSTVGSISNFEKPGYKIGLSVEVNLSSRLALTTGVVHSNVRYTAQGREYKPPSGYWTNGIVANETFAECALLDIPISLKYDVLQFSRSRLFATAGLSSYIMLNEDYRFRYDSENPDLTRGWSGKTGTRHWFSSAGFSIGYEYDLLPNWSIQAEPFISLPLKEVGWGNVKLYSVGSFVSLNFKLK